MTRLRSGVVAHCPLGRRHEVPRRIAIRRILERDVEAGGMAARLADVLAVQIIRSWMKHAGADDLGWIAAARHPRIGPVLAAIHARPDDDWTVGRLADQAGMSRSAFAAAFADIVSETPARSLAEVRMHQARQ